MSRDGRFACGIHPAVQSAIGEQQWVTGFHCVRSVVGWLIVCQLGILSLSCISSVANRHIEVIFKMFYQMHKTFEWNLSRISIIIPVRKATNANGVIKKSDGCLILDSCQ